MSEIHHDEPGQRRATLRFCPTYDLLLRLDFLAMIIISASRRNLDYASQASLHPGYAGYRLVAAVERGRVIRRAAVLPAWAGDIPTME